MSSLIPAPPSSSHPSHPTHPIFFPPTLPTNTTHHTLHAKPRTSMRTLARPTHISLAITPHHSITHPAPNHNTNSPQPAASAASLHCKPKCVLPCASLFFQPSHPASPTPSSTNSNRHHQTTHQSHPTTTTAANNNSTATAEPPHPVTTLPLGAGDKNEALAANYLLENSMNM